MKTIAAAVIGILLFSGCASMKSENPLDLVSVEAVVRRYVPDSMNICFSDGTGAEAKSFLTELEVKVPSPRFQKILPARSVDPLPESHPFRHIGATVRFTVERQYLVEILTDPRKRHDLPFLYLGAVHDLTEKKDGPNQPLQGTPGTVPSSSTEPEARRP